MTQAAGWYADPAGRHEHRWWDGATWTDHVADGGVAEVDPLPTTGPGLDVALDAELAGLLARVDAAGLPEHPKLELSTSLNVANGVLWILAVDPSRADDAEGTRLADAAVLHRHLADVDPAGAAPALRILAFHVLLALPGDTAALAEVFFGVLDPTPAERELMQTLHRYTPGMAWDDGYLELLHERLVAALVPAGGVTLTLDALQFLWAVTRGILQPYALALFPELAE
jgi:hypothetical protein